MFGGGSVEMGVKGCIPRFKCVGGGVEVPRGVLVDICRGLSEVVPGWVCGSV